MKKLAISASLCLFALAGALTSCSSDGDKGAAKTRGTATEAAAGITNIRVYDLDSVMTHYKLIDKLNSDAEASVARYQQAERQKSNELQKLADEFQKKAQSGGYITEQSYNADMQTLQKKQQAAEQYLAGLQQQIAQQSAAQQKQFLDSINAFLTDYNDVYGFDAILIKQPGMFFSESLDITQDVINGLNDRYDGKYEKPAKKVDAEVSTEAAEAVPTEAAEGK